MGFQEDKEATIKSRAALLKNKNLIYWYEKLFETQFAGRDVNNLKILEIGSGSSPIQFFYKNITTSDVLELDYVDYVFDCLRIDSVDSIEECSVDMIVMTNVLHHLADPVLFFEQAATKLKEGGSIVATEPYISSLSRIVYQYFHHEDIDLTVEKPLLQDASGPLSSANIALPYLLFVNNNNWLSSVHDLYEITMDSYFTSLSYFLTGGVSHKIPLPLWCFRMFFSFDRLLAEKFPRAFASFFTVTLTKKSIASGCAAS